MSTQQKLHENFHLLPLMQLQKKKNRKKRVSPHLNVGKDSNTKKDKKSWSFSFKEFILRWLIVNSICYFLSVLYVSVWWKNNQRTDQRETFPDREMQKGKHG